MSDMTRRMMLAITGFLLILISLAALADPPIVLAESVENQNKETSEETGTLTFLSSYMPPFGTVQDGKQVGFAVEILHEIMQRIGRADTIEFGD